MNGIVYKMKGKQYYMNRIKWILISIIIVVITITGTYLFLNHKKNDYTINYNKHIQLAEIISYDAGEYSIEEERKTGTYYLLYTDGNLLTYDRYTKSVIKNNKLPIDNTTCGLYNVASVIS